MTDDDVLKRAEEVQTERAEVRQDELSVWTRALGPTEISDWYDEQNPAGSGALRNLPDGGGAGGWMDMTSNVLLMHGDL